MRTVVRKNWRELAEVWDDLYCGNHLLSAYQSYEFLTVTGKGKPGIFNGQGLIPDFEEFNYVMYDDGEPVVIAPLLLGKRKGTSTVYFRGHFTNAGSLDFVYRPGWNYGEFCFLMDSLKNSLGEVVFKFDKVSDRSPTCGFLKEYFQGGRVEKKPCVTICVDGDYDGWLGGLSKSVRHNIRTSYNRLERDNIECSAVFYRGPGVVDRETLLGMMKLYTERFFEKNRYNLGPLVPVAKKALLNRRMRDNMTKALAESENSLNVVLYMDKKMAAFCSGFFCNDGRFIVPRLSINSEFSLYSPGRILIDKVVRDITECNGNCERCRQLDLSCGDEHYKYQYGGTTYFNYCFTC